MSVEPELQSSTRESAKACPEDCFKLRMVFWLLVCAQFLIAGMIVLLLESAFAQTPTTAVACLGIAIGVWAIVSMNRKTLNVSPQLRKSAKLVVTGPYRFVRHPMYSALLTFCGGYVVSDHSWFGFQLWCGLLIVLWIKSAYEEQMLRSRFAEYEMYVKRVRRFIPFAV